MQLGDDRPVLQDEAIRLVPLTPEHESGVAELADDGDVREFTRVPSTPAIRRQMLSGAIVIRMRGNPSLLEDSSPYRRYYP